MTSVPDYSYPSRLGIVSRREKKTFRVRYYIKHPVLPLCYDQVPSIIVNIGRLNLFRRFTINRLRDATDEHSPYLRISTSFPGCEDIRGLHQDVCAGKVEAKVWLKRVPARRAQVEECYVMSRFSGLFDQPFLPHRP